MGCNTSQEQQPPPTPGATNNEPEEDNNKSGDASNNNDDNGKLELEQRSREETPSVPSNGTENNKRKTTNHNNNINNKTNDDNSDKKLSIKNEEPNKGEIQPNGIIPTEDMNGFECDEFGKDEEEAATRIQAVFRGHQVRATMKKGDTPEETNKKGSSGEAPPSSAIDPTQNANNEPEPTKEELEAEFDPNDKELCHAATKIQATFRGHLQRKLANSDPKTDADIDEITKKVAEELDIDLTDPELHKAATKIQASFRGHKIRKDVTPSD